MQQKLTHGGDWAGFEAEYGRPPLDFSANVSPLDVPWAVRRAVAKAARQAARYPDPLCRRLTEALALHEKVEQKQILCGNGAADLIFRVVLAKKPRTALVTAPTFAEYGQALETVDCRVKQHMLTEENGFAVTPTILEEITPELDMLFLCEPNNPTGVLTEPVLLAGDIDRGGVFAQLYGTVALLNEEERKRVKGLIINKFRGDVDILSPGLTQLAELTGLPVVGVIPYTRVDIDDEDSLAPRLNAHEAHRPVDVAVIRLPHISNFTDFSPLESHPALGVRYVEQASGLGAPDLIMLPGTKSTMADLGWMRQNGLEAAVRKLAAAGTPVLGVCGGYQMLGQTLRDPEGVEQAGEMRGMGLLPCETEFTPSKARTCTAAKVLTGPFAGAAMEGHEIHMGRTKRLAGQPLCRLENGQEEGAMQGNVFGTYLHGFFDESSLTEALASWLLARKGIAQEAFRPQSHREYQQSQYDLLADAVRASLDLDAVYQVMGLANPNQKK